MTNDFSVLLRAVLDTKCITKRDITEVQKVVDKYTLNLATDLDKADLIKNIRQLVPGLEKELSKITGIDIKINDNSIEKAINQVVRDNQRLQKELDRTAQKARGINLKIDTLSYETEISGLTNQLSKYGEVSGKVFSEAKQSANKLYDLYQKMQHPSSDDERVRIEKEYQKTLKKTKNLLTQIKEHPDNQLLPNGSAQRVKMASALTNYLSKNTGIPKENKNEIQKWIDALNSLDDMTRHSVSRIKSEFESLDATLRSSGKLGFSKIDKIKNAWEKFGGWAMATGSLTFFASKVRESFPELKNVNTILTEISKTSDITKTKLSELGKKSFDAASAFGRKATDFLLAVQEANRSGYYNERGNQMAELSIIAQSAGDMDSKTANNYLLATNAAYKYEGEVEKLNAVLDGQNVITNRNSVDMQTMAEATEKAGSTASMTGVKIEELSAMIGTIEASTKEAGAEVGTGIKSLLINLQNSSSDKIVTTLKEANAEMTTMKNGVEQMRSPMDILKDLANTFNSLDKSDPLKSKILTNIGQKYHANELSALLSNWDKYEKMLNDYSEGSGSAVQEAMKSANNWEGSLNRLGNTWTETIQSIADTDAIIFTINRLNDLLGAVNNITSTIGGFGTFAPIISGLLGANGLGLTLNYSS